MTNVKDRLNLLIDDKLKRCLLGDKPHIPGDMIMFDVYPSRYKWTRDCLTPVEFFYLLYVMCSHSIHGRVYNFIVVKE